MALVSVLWSCKSAWIVSKIRDDSLVFAEAWTYACLCLRRFIIVQGWKGCGREMGEPYSMDRASIVESAEVPQVKIQRDKMKNLAQLGMNGI